MGQALGCAVHVDSALARGGQVFGELLSQHSEDVGLSACLRFVGQRSTGVETVEAKDWLKATVFAVYLLDLLSVEVG